jgi:hypothetical protein
VVKLHFADFEKNEFKIDMTYEIIIEVRTLPTS